MTSLARDNGTAKRSVDAVLATLDRVAEAVIVAVVAAMVAIVAAEVVGRYVMRASIGWADEVARLAFVWTIFLAIPLGVRLGSHIGIDLLVKMLPEPLREVLLRLVMLASAGVMAIVAWQAILVAADQWDERMPSLPFSAQLFLVPVAAGAAHAMLHLLRIAAFGAYPAPAHVMGTE